MIALVTFIKKMARHLGGDDIKAINHFLREIIDNPTNASLRMLAGHKLVCLSPPT